jgi:3-hydroxypropanoate dehydrogenase
MTNVLTDSTQSDAALPDGSVAPNRLDPAGRSLLFTDARTVSNFAPTPVTDAELAEIWELAKWAPTGGNMQPLRVLYVRTDEGKARLIEHLNDTNKAKSASAPAVAVLALDSRFHEHIPTIFPIRPEIQEVFEADESFRETSAKLNSAIQTGYFVLAVRALGLSAGPMGGFDAAALDADFFPDGRWKSILVVNIGHPGTNPHFGRLPRLAHEDVIDWA